MQLQLILGLCSATISPFLTSQTSQYDEVAETLAIAASSNETLSVALSASSIQTISGPVPLTTEPATTTTTSSSTTTSPSTTSATTSSPTTSATTSQTSSSTTSPSTTSATTSSPTTSATTSQTSSSTTSPSTTSATTASPTTSASSGVEPIYIVSATLPQETFQEELTNPNSTTYKELERRVIDTCTPIYTRKYGTSFVRCFVKQFRPVRLREDATAADIGVVLRNNIPISDLPNNDEVAETLAIAASSNETLSVALSASSIQTISGPVPLTTEPATTTTTSSSTTTSPSTTSATTSSPTTSATTSQTSSSTTSPSTTSATTASPTTSASSGVEPIYIVSATLPQETFQEELTNPNSTTYKELERRVIDTCTPIYTRKYGTRFVRCFVKQFRPVRLREDATAADIGVVLRNNIPISDLPNNDEVAETLAIAASSNETLSVALSASSIQTICK
ncbi:mucin-2-like [Takifugu flavidus]|uniref:mucin-2-like n=1 Tax=Takifugu flavidus TaxID=433684 RepID=UPI002544C06A|nr:mucin-2-like [Takifugu flavidus]